MGTQFNACLDRGYILAKVVIVLELDERDCALLEQLKKNMEQMLLGRLSVPIPTESGHDLINSILEMFNMINVNLAEMNAFANQLSKGNVDIDVPGRRNYLAAPLKGLHAQLSHVMWSVQQLEKGQFVQQLGFMGEFSDVFNQAIERLNQRELQLKGTIESYENSGEDLEQFQLFWGIFNAMREIVIVSEEKTGNILLMNKPAHDFLNKLDNLNQQGKTTTQQVVLSILREHTLSGQPYLKGEVFDQKLALWYKAKSQQVLLTTNKMIWMHQVEDITSQKELEESLRYTATFDTLTNAYSRRIGLEALDKAIENSGNVPACLCMIDMDGLKYINDNYGHLEGDYALSSIANCIRVALRSGDILSRFGGDEFLVIFNNCSDKEAEVIMKTVQGSLDELNMTNDKPYRLSFSYGVEPLIAGKSLNSTEIMTLTDKKMYERKRMKKHKNQSK